MSWNEPGSNKDGSNKDGNKNPWGDGSNQGPPDLDEMIRKLQEKIGAIFGGGNKKSSNGASGGAAVAAPKGLGTLIVGAVIAWLVYDSVYIIQPAERGVVLRFGEFVQELNPGPSIRFPRPIEKVYRVNVEQINNVEVGYRSRGNDSVRTVPSEALMLTKDENIIDINFAVQYRIKNAADYLFQLKDPDLTLHQATESAVRETIGQNNMDFVITEGRSEIVSRTEVLIQEIMDRYQSGLHITSVNMQDAQPPEQVQDAFHDAVKAREDEQRYVNEAEAYSNDIIPKARGNAARQLAEADAYKAKIVAEAMGEAERFSKVRIEFERAPIVTRQRIYLESMEHVFSNSKKVIIDTKGSNNLLYLPLDKLISSSSSSSSSRTRGSDDVFNTQESSFNSSSSMPRGSRLRDRSQR